MNNIATIIGALGLVALIVGIAWCQPQQTIIIYGENETMTIEEGIAPDPPQGVRILDEPYPGQQERRYEDYRPVDTLRQWDGTRWVEVEIGEIDSDGNISIGGANEGDYWE